MRGATADGVENLVYGWISIHAPHTGRDVADYLAAHPIEISIHAPHTGRDVGFIRIFVHDRLFQSTRPIRGATMIQMLQQNAKSPFQSTRPIRGATRNSDDSKVCGKISIHAPHTGRDLEKGRF